MSLGARHADDRGVIQDILCEDFDSATIIHTRAGKVRGNHFHRETFQWAYIVSGALLVVTQDLAGNEVKHKVYREGQLQLSPPMEAHAWKAFEDTTVLVLTRGPRSGEGYESDTYRLDEPLVT